MSAVQDVTKLSWAPEIEQEVQRYREESKKLRLEEDRLMEARRKSRFELERASWDVERQNHLVGLVLGQLEELEKEIEAGSDTNSTTGTTNTSSGNGSSKHHLHDRSERHEPHHRSNGSKSGRSSSSRDLRDHHHHPKSDTTEDASSSAVTGDTPAATASSPSSPKVATTTTITDPIPTEPSSEA